MATPLDITVIVLSFNEAVHIDRCIGLIRDRVRRVIVVDSFSTDDTVERARAMGADVYQHEFVNQAQQLGWAISTIPIDTAWTLRLDCDEYLDPEALDWLTQELPTLPATTVGVEFRLKVVFQERHIRFGGYYSTELLRLWRTGSGSVEQRWMDERVIVSGATVLATGNLVDENLNSIGWWTTKHNRYATRHVIDFVMLRHVPAHRAATSGQLLSRRARMKRFLRNRVYARAPLFVRPLLYWFYRYFVLGGFLDGRQGLVWHFLHGFWYYMLIDTKVAEAERIVARDGLDGLAKHFRTRFGIELTSLTAPTA